MLKNRNEDNLMKFAKHKYINLPRPQQPCRLHMPVMVSTVNPYHINMAVPIDIDATDSDVQRLSSDSFSSCAVFSNCPLTT